ncbi:MFS general substrate transporter [Westerdykella ornata]|uniref:MFS general substrate transporter n=1 Tax=Westerdykella ornata TaxID=318751 RepID=A0A6A6JEL9_WESOR|nr:MFS general substrate transporter [Westerdykella ornata]KAF2274613.1 MFS general substrate transporter [Westerdykella ornata]
MEDLEKTYSREQQRLGNGYELRVQTTPYSLVRSPTQGITMFYLQAHFGRCAHIGVVEERLQHPDDRIGANDFDAHFESEEKEVKPTLSATSTPRDLSSQPSGGTTPARKIIRFDDDDPAQPNNWSQKRKLLAISVAIMTVMNSTIASSLAAGATEQISERFGVDDEYQLILPTSIYLVGYTCGPLIWGPLSETFGRKWPTIISFAMFNIFSIASAVSPTFAALVIFRWLVGVGGSCALAVVGGICADIYHDPRARGRSMAYFMAATTFGPIMGPPVSGFIAKVSWSWAFWIGAIIAGATWPLLIAFPETYAPIILKHQAQRLRKETGDMSIVAPIELEKTDIGHIVTTVITRPFRMIIFEPLVLFTCLYLSYAYAIFYIFFQSYPIIFSGIYSFNAGETGLTFLPIGIGAIISALFYLAWDTILDRAQAAQRPWSKSEEMRRLPLACIAGPFLVLSLFWAGWSARPDVHWIVPVLSGIPFGVGYLCLFMALLNYLVDAYEIFAASAMAAASFSRSAFGAVLPFAARPMYRSLGVPWACSLLGFLSVALCAVPFVFLKWGHEIRRRSRFCQYLAKKKREEAEEREGTRKGMREGGNANVGGDIEVHRRSLEVGKGEDRC